jgi:hypothetical protein
MRLSSILALMVVLVLSAGVQADILTYSCDNDGDGAIDCQMTRWEEVGLEYDMDIVGNQFEGPGHMIGNFTTDDPLDPTISVMNSIDNYTGYDWTGYQVLVMLNNPFSILSASVTQPGDWLPAVIAQPSFYGSFTNNGQTYTNMYVGQIDYSGGTPVLTGTDELLGDGETLDFKYKISFQGSTGYTLVQEMNPVPEPGTISLLILGLIALAAFKLRK